MYILEVESTKRDRIFCDLCTSLIRIELTHPPPEGGALSTELRVHILISAVSERMITNGFKNEKVARHLLPLP